MRRNGNLVEHRLWVATILSTLMVGGLAGCTGKHVRPDDNSIQSTFLSKFPNLGKGSEGDANIPGKTGIGVIDDIQAHMSKMAAPGFATMK